MRTGTWIALLAAFGCGIAQAGSGPLGIDHEWSLDQSGIWRSNVQTGLEFGVIAVEVGGALWFGNNDEFGHVMWQDLDATAVAALSAEALKYAFSRARPNQGDDPNRWFQGHCCDSFPSGQVTIQASFVTPIILHYRQQQPLVWLLELLPAYDAVARLKNQDHWQSDVLAGWLLGSAAGYWSSGRAVPLTVEVLPHGLSVGFSKSF